MLTRSAENSFRKGKAALRAGEAIEAMAYFEAAIRRDLEVNGEQKTMKYLSYYGLCLALTTRSFREALSLCEQAAESDFYDPDMYWNLGQVSLRGGDRRRAVRAFRRGLAINGTHTGMLAEMRRLGFRRQIVFPFLSRTNPLNRVAGLIRSQLRTAAPGGRGA